MVQGGLTWVDRHEARPYPVPASCTTTASKGKIRAIEATRKRNQNQTGTVPEFRLRAGWCGGGASEKCREKAWNAIRCATRWAEGVQKWRESAVCPPKPTVG